ncbi:hypothetical protein [Roseateles sp. PN1]|uniref:hypothetical protein n=1 Tax=Roseateles sp. PN1 TaxID=3137372 RepID=UPI003138E08E
MNGTPPHAIRTVRVPARLAGEQRLRQGLERLLAEADPARHGLPGDAIVLVRRLAMRWSALQAGDSATRYAPLAALLASARRATSADSDAEAVWFADEAEMLACLARDGQAGLLDQRWWWRAVLQPHRSGRWGASSRQEHAALTRWLQAPQLMPRALQRLGPLRAQAWLASLGREGMSRLLTALAQAYALPDPIDAWVLDGQDAAFPDRQGLQLPPVMRDAATTDAVVAERLLRICTALLSDASALANTAGLWPLARREERDSPTGQPSTGLRTPPLGRGTAKPQKRAKSGELASAKQAHPLPCLTPAKAAPGPAADAPSVAPDVDSNADTDCNVTGADASQGNSTSASASWPASDRSQALQPPARTTVQADTGPQARQTDIHAAFPRSTDTRHGGLFFLLNAALALGLYGDFTQPRHRGLACPPWRLLLLAGQAWAGPGWRHDPLRRRLIERSAGSHEPLPLPLWPRLHARLAEALGDAAELPARAQIRHMLSLPARLLDRSERMDIFYPLARLPLAVRLAGLDRDPGWIPAAGCDIRFHFD